MQKRSKTSQEIENEANILMEGILIKLSQYTESELRFNQFHNERGIDFALEFQRTTAETTNGLTTLDLKKTVFLQNKGSEGTLTARKKGPNKGFITYKFDEAETLRYLALDHDNVCLITVCDLESESVYWCPIQLEYNHYARRVEAIETNSEENNKGASIQLRIDPTRCLRKNGRLIPARLPRLKRDIEASEDLLLERRMRDRSHHLLGKDGAQILVDKTKPLLEQLYRYMVERFGELHHMPSEFFAQSYPFRVSNSFHARHDQFTLTVDNDRLIELFKTVKVNGPGKVQFTDSSWTQGVSNPQKKVRFILKRLSSSLVFYIAAHKSREWVSVRYSDSAECDCVRCRIDRLDFRRAFEALSAGVSQQNNLQLMAYSHYKLGNFIEAAELLEQANEEHKRKEEWSQYVLSSYSLSKLRTHLRSNYWGEQEPTELIERLAKIDLAAIRMTLPQADKNSRFHEWIDKGRFHSETMYVLYKTVSEIRDHYYSQLRGGWSSNSHISELIKDYADLDEFLSKDFVYFDRFDEYRQIVDLFSEGLFASHAIAPEQKSRLAHFDDWTINKLVWYSEPNRILKHFHRHHLKEIQYKPSASPGESFVAVLTRILDDAKEVAKAFKKSYIKTNSSFIQKYNTLVANHIVLASISNLNAADVNVIARKLPEALRSNTLLNRGITEHIQRFVQRKAKLIDKETLEALLRSVPKSQKLHDENLLSALSEALRHHGGVALSIAKVQPFIALTTGKCPLCKHEHPGDWLIPIHRLSSSVETRGMIEQSIEARLRTRFEPDLYYEAVIHDVLKFDEDFFNRLLLAARPADDYPSFRTAMSGEEDKRRPILDMFINLCFKEGIDLRHERFTGLRGFDSYYDWLLDMGGFDYSQFSVKWVTAYPTKYYFGEIRKHDTIRVRISEYLKDHRDPQLERTFVDLYGG